MNLFSISVDIEASPAQVWSVMADIERWHEWTASVTSIRRLEEGPLAVGCRAVIRQPRFLPARWEITELVEGSNFAWVTRSPGVRVTARHSVVETSPGSQATLSVEYAGFLGPLVSRFFRGITERYLALEAAGLKTRSEALSKESAGS